MCLVTTLQTAQRTVSLANALTLVLPALLWYLQRLVECATTTRQMSPSTSPSMRCIALAHLVRSCGSIGKVCSAPSGGSAVCANGGCSFTCNNNWFNTGSSCLNTQSDVLNCVCSFCLIDALADYLYRVEAARSAPTLTTDHQSATTANVVSLAPQAFQLSVVLVSTWVTISRSKSLALFFTDCTNKLVSCGRSGNVCNVPANGVASCTNGNCAFT